MTGNTWTDLFPEGRFIVYEGKAREGFATAIKAQFGFDPSKDPAWRQPYLGGDIECGADPFGRTLWFECPPEHLDALYGSGRWEVGS